MPYKNTTTQQPILPGGGTRLLRGREKTKLR